MKQVELGEERAASEKAQRLFYKYRRSWVQNLEFSNIAGTSEAQEWCDQLAINHELHGPTVWLNIMGSHVFSPLPSTKPILSHPSTCTRHDTARKILPAVFLPWKPKYC